MLKKAVIFFLGIGAIFVLFSAYVAYAPVHKDYKDIGPNVLKIGDAELRILIADTPALRTQGLSGRAMLHDNEGMLFIFETPGKYPFWMKDMRFPLDIIWIGDDRRVTEITPNVSADSYPRHFSPHVPVRYVLEVNAGFSRRFGIATGTPVSW